MMMFCVWTCVRIFVGVRAIVYKCMCVRACIWLHACMPVCVCVRVCGCANVFACAQVCVSVCVFKRKKIAKCVLISSLYWFFSPSWYNTTARPTLLLFASKIFLLSSKKWPWKYPQSESTVANWLLDGGSSFRCTWVQNQKNGVGGWESEYQAVFIFSFSLWAKRVCVCVWKLF